MPAAAMSARPPVAFANAAADLRSGGAGAPPPPPPTPAASAELLRGRLMQRSLQALLDRVPGSRAALPYLAALETALIEHGTAAVPAISPKGLAKIHQQLRILPLDAADGAIQDLLALVQRALRQQARQQRTHQLSPHDPQSTVVISEGSETDFMNALAEARAGAGH